MGNSTAPVPLKSDKYKNHPWLILSNFRNHDGLFLRTSCLWMLLNSIEPPPVLAWIWIISLIMSLSSPTWMGREKSLLSFFPHSYGFFFLPQANQLLATSNRSQLKEKFVSELHAIQSMWWKRRCEVTFWRKAIFSGVDFMDVTKHLNVSLEYISLWPYNSIVLH